MTVAYSQRFTVQFTFHSISWL
ncbi:protein of unknown function [Burkholderia multivorans]